MTVSMLAGALPGCHHLTVMYTHTKHTLCSAQQLTQKKCFFRCEWSFLVEHNTPPVSCWVSLSHLSLLKVEAGRKTRTGWTGSGSGSTRTSTCEHHGLYPVSVWFLFPWFSPTAQSTRQSVAFSFWLRATLMRFRDFHIKFDWSPDWLIEQIFGPNHEVKHQPVWTELASPNSNLKSPFFPRTMPGREPEPPGSSTVTLRPPGLLTLTFFHSQSLTLEFAVFRCCPPAPHPEPLSWQPGPGVYPLPALDVWATSALISFQK